MQYSDLRVQIEEMLSQRIKFSDSDNLLGLGLNSLMIMRIASQWRRQGIKISFGELMEEPTLVAWWNLIQSKSGKKLDLPIHSRKEASCHKPFPLTDVQYAYWVGRRENQILGNIGCHAYLEFDGTDVNPVRLEKAWRSLQYHHPMLRARFLENGTQEVMDKPYQEKITIYDYREKSDEHVTVLLDDIRIKLSHRKLKVDEGEVASIALSLLPNHKSRIHFDIDLLVADVQSLQIILNDLLLAYEEKKLPVYASQWNFASYLQLQDAINKEEREQARQYWKNRLKTLPLGPDLPLAKRPEQIKEPRFTRRITDIDIKNWNKLKQKAAHYQTTPAMMLLTAYAVVLERWSVSKRFLINVPLFNRQTEVVGIENVVADFTTLVLLEIDCQDNPDFLTLLNRIQKQMHNDMKYSKYSGVQVQRDLATLYEEQINVAPIVFACNLGSSLVKEEFTKKLGHFSYMISQTPQVWLDFQSYEDENGVMLTWDAIDELFPAHMLDDMKESFDGLIKRMLKEHWEQHFDILPTIRMKAIEKEATIEKRMEVACIHDAFLEWISKTPEAVALVDTGKQITFTYRELSDRVKSVAAMLVKEKIKDEPIAITLPRGYEQIEAALAILLSGNYYVPISIEQPAERRNRIHEKTKIQYVITDKDTVQKVTWDSKIQVFILEVMEQQKPLTTYPEVSPESTAYIIMTSGSTGLPKGVEIIHKSAWNTILDINKRYHVNQTDAVLAVSSMDFDLSVYDTFGILGSGGKLILLPQEESKNPDFWLKQIVKYNITMWNSVPILLEMLLVCAKARNVMSLPFRIAMLSGDWIPLDLPKQFYSLTKNSIFIAMGGATEGSIWSNIQEVRLPLPSNWVSIPYGRPLSGQAYRVIDEIGRDCPYWVEGELLIGGHGVAKCYRGDDTLTAQKFIEDQYGRWYRTGDKGRIWEDNTIEFCGRKDYQVKVKGHRIELGEIENALCSITGVKDAMVSAISHNSRKNMLVAIIVAETEQWSEQMITKLLRSKLPEYMIPSKILFRESLPITGNGKRDQKAINMWIQNQFSHSSKIQRNLTETERKVIAIWNRLFSLHCVSLNDNFFHCGGDSLMAVRLASQLQEEFHVKVTLDLIFQYSTVEQLATVLQAKIIENQRKDEPEQTNSFLHKEEDRLKEFATTKMQYAYWIGRQGIYTLGNVSSYCYYELYLNHLNIKRLEQCWNQLIMNCDSLRLIFSKDGRMQRVLEKTPYYKLKQYRFGNISFSDKQKELLEVREEMEQQVIDASKWPLFDIRVSAFAQDEYIVHIGIDNMIMDARSVLGMLGQLTQRYEEQTINRYEKEVFSFRDFVCQERKKENTYEYVRDKQYWQSKQEHFPASPNLPICCKPEMIKKQKFVRETIKVSSEQWLQIKSFAKEKQVTPGNMLLAVYILSLSHISDEIAFAMNITVNLRSQYGQLLDYVTGDFTGNLLLAAEVDGTQEFWAFTRRIQQTLIEDMNHMNYSGIEFQRDLMRTNPVKYVNGMPCVFTCTLGMENHRLFGEVRYNITQTPQVWIDHQVEEREGKLYLNFDYLQEMFEPEVIQSIKTDYSQMLTEIYETGELKTNATEYQEGVL